MAQAWMRLDTNFFEDRAVQDLEDLKGESAVAKLVKIYCVASEENGLLDTKNGSISRLLGRKTKLKGKRLETFMDACIEVGLFDKELWEVERIITSERLMREARRTEDLRQQRIEAAQASVKARQKLKAEREANA